MTSQSNLEAAIDYASRDLRVFPIWPAIAMPPPHEGFICACTKTLRCEHPAKHPMGRLVPHGVNDASTDERLIRHWWQCRSNANIGIATTGLIVIDVDPRHGGDIAMGAIERKHGALPPTWRVITGGHGQHAYFRSRSGAISGTTGGPGIDIKANGGYVIAPPSNHISGGRYRWLDGHSPDDLPLAPVPEWLFVCLQEAKPSGSSPTSLDMARARQL